MYWSGCSPVPNRSVILKRVIFDENAKINDSGSLRNERRLKFGKKNNML
jgi:hypothetical protein